MTNTTKTPAFNHAAIRTFDHVLAQRMKLIDQGEAADHGFDAGEFSGSFYADLREQAWYETLELVAPKFGLTPEQLGNQIVQAAHDEYFSMVQAKRHQEG